MNKLLFIFLVAFFSCNENMDIKPPIIEENDDDEVNYDHFDHLYKEIDFKGKKVGIVNIYSEYPNYDFAIEPNEGFTCVDDVSRAVVLLSNHLKTHDKDEVAYDKMKKMVEFVLEMQHTNGYFNNFIWHDLSINTTYQTSVAQLNWWSFRALWALESAYPFLNSDADLSDRVQISIERLIENIKQDIPLNNFDTTTIETIKVPTWLPQKFASDQTALLILGLLENHKRTGDNEIATLIDALAKGIMVMQKGSEGEYPYGMFLSWGNLWHAWGNSQSYALLKAGQQFDNQTMINSALKEIDNFYPYLLKDGFAEAIWIKKIGNGFIEDKRNQYPQIAYGLRPMVWAANEAYRYTKEEKYQALSNNLEQWLLGANVANKTIYHSTTGICFDGIVSNDGVNKNSGAESTIESLLILTDHIK